METIKQMEKSICFFVHTKIPMKKWRKNMHQMPKSNYICSPSSQLLEKLCSACILCIRDFNQWILLLVYDPFVVAIYFIFFSFSLTFVFDQQNAQQPHYIEVVLKLQSALVESLLIVYNYFCRNVSMCICIS